MYCRHDTAPLARTGEPRRRLLETPQHAHAPSAPPPIPRRWPPTTRRRAACRTQSPSSSCGAGRQARRSQPARTSSTSPRAPPRHALEGHHVPRRVPHHALGQARGAAGVQDVARVRRVDGHRGRRLGRHHGLVPVHVPPCDHACRCLRPLQAAVPHGHGARVKAGVSPGPGSHTQPTAWHRHHHSTHMRHASGWCRDASNAASSSGLYSSTRSAPSRPHDAETTTLGAASSMRTASSWDAKPPNTCVGGGAGECGASGATHTRGTPPPSPCTHTRTHH